MVRGAARQRGACAAAARHAERVGGEGRRAVLGDGEQS